LDDIVLEGFSRFIKIKGTTFLGENIECNLTNNRAGNVVIDVSKSPNFELSESEFYGKNYDSEAGFGDAFALFKEPRGVTSLGWNHFENIDHAKGAFVFNLGNPIGFIPTVFFHYNQIIDSTSLGSGAPCITVDKTTKGRFYITYNNFENPVNSEHAFLGGKGGALYLRTSNSSTADVVYNIEGNTFENTYADSVGGAAYVVNANVNWGKGGNGNDWNGNFDSRGSNIVAGHGNILLVTTTEVQPNSLCNPNDIDGTCSTSFDEVSLSDMNSGDSLGSQGFSITLVDQFGQAVHDDSDSVLSVGAGSRRLLASTSNEETSSSVTCDNGVYDLTNVAVTFPPGSTGTLSFSSNGIEPMASASNPTPTATTPQPTFAGGDQEVDFATCGFGQWILPNQSCVDCPAGTMQLKRDPVIGDHCSACPAGLICGAAGKTGPTNGYWRFAADSDITVHCRNPSACLGANGDSGSSDSRMLFSSTGYCHEHYQGNLCDTCIDGYGKARDYLQCVECGHDAGFYFAFLGQWFCSFILLYLTVNSILANGNDYTAYFAPKGKGPRNLALFIIIRNLMDYIQVASLIGNTSSDWPFSFRNAVQFTETLVFSRPDAFSMNCLLASTHSHMQKIFVELVVINMLPFVYYLAAFIVIAMSYMSKGKSVMSKEFGRTYGITCLVITFSMLTTLIINNLRMFQCENLYRTDDPKYFLSADFSVQCWDQDHNSWTLAFALPFLIIWALIVPLIAFFRIKRALAPGATEDQKLYASFLISGYQRDSPWWGFIVLMRKYLMIIVTTFVSYKYGFVQIWMATAVCVFSFVIHYYRAPVKNVRLERLESVNLLCIGLLALLGIFFDRIPRVAGFYQIVLIFTIALNFAYFVQWFIELIRIRINDQAKNPEKKKQLLKYFEGSARIRDIFFEEESFLQLAGKPSKIPVKEIKEEVEHVKLPNSGSSSSNPNRLATEKPLKEQPIEEESLVYNSPSNQKQVASPNNEESYNFGSPNNNNTKLTNKNPKEEESLVFNSPTNNNSKANNNETQNFVNASKMGNRTAKVREDESLQFSVANTSKRN
jgi:hypothetical protein